MIPYAPSGASGIGSVGRLGGYGSSWQRLVRLLSIILTGVVMLTGAGMLVGAGGSASANGPLRRDDPAHLGPVPPGGYNLPMAPPVTPFPLPPQFVMIRSTEDWRSLKKVDPELSRACANRTFRERIGKRYRAVFQKDILGVAFGHGDNLYDPKGLADRRKIYLFRNGDSTGCLVIVIDNQDARALDNADAPPAR